MPPSYYSHGLPEDLAARLVVARRSAEQQFEEATRGRSRTEIRRLLIDVRIKPEVVEFVRVTCEMAARQWISVGEIESVVDNYRRERARCLCPDRMTNSAWDADFQREVEEAIARSDEWRSCRTVIIETAARIAKRTDVQSAVALEREASSSDGMTRDRVRVPGDVVLPAAPTSTEAEALQRAAADALADASSASGSGTTAHAQRYATDQRAAAAARSAAINTLLEQLNRHHEGGGRFSRRDVWALTRYSARQCQYWQAANPKTTESCTAAIEKLLATPIADLLTSARTMRLPRP